MDGSQFYHSSTSFQIRYVMPISLYEKYSPVLEFSDKLILPRAVLVFIKQTHLPLPPVFTLGYLNNYIPILCGALEFSAPANTVYCPSWILKKMSKKPTLFANEAVLELLKPKKNSNTVYPGMKKIEIFSTESITVEMCRKGLMRYTVINKGEWLQVSNGNEVFRIYISGLFPKNKCIMKSKTFEIVLMDCLSQTQIINDTCQDINPLIESIFIPQHTPKKGKSKSKKIENYNSNYSSLFPQNSRMIPLRNESIIRIDTDILPWDKDELIKIHSIPSNAFSDRSQNRKLDVSTGSDKTPMTLPQLKTYEKRPLTTLQSSIIFKPREASPASKRIGFRNKNNSVT